MNLSGSTLALVVAFGLADVLASAATEPVKRYSRRSELNDLRSIVTTDAARPPQEAKCPAMLPQARVVQPSRSPAALSSAVLLPAAAKFNATRRVSRPDAREVQIDLSNQPKLLPPVRRRPGLVHTYERRFSTAPAVTITRRAAPKPAEPASHNRFGVPADLSRTGRARAIAAAIDAPAGVDDLR